MYSLFLLRLLHDSEIDLSVPMDIANPTNKPPVNRFSLLAFMIPSVGFLILLLLLIHKWTSSMIHSLIISTTY